MGSVKLRSDMAVKVSSVLSRSVKLGLDRAVKVTIKKGSVLLIWYTVKLHMNGKQDHV